MNVMGDEGTVDTSFIEPEELSKYIVLTISFDSDMISEELRINRFNVQ